MYLALYDKLNLDSKVYSVNSWVFFIYLHESENHSTKREFLISN